MSSTIKLWWAARKEAARVREFNRGFDWAAGMVLRGEASVREIENDLWYSGDHQFDSGAVQALRRLSTLLPQEDQL